MTNKVFYEVTFNWASGINPILPSFSHQKVERGFQEEAEQHAQSTQSKKGMEC